MLGASFVAIVGGNWNNGSNAGLRYVNGNNGFGNANNNIGALSDSKRARDASVLHPLSWKGRVSDQKHSATFEHVRMPGCGAPIGNKETSIMDKKNDPLFEEFVSFDNLHAAAMEVATGKWRKSEWAKWYLNLETNIIDLQNRLIWDMWRPHPTVDFYVMEPKKRPVARPHIEDRIVGHALMRIILPYLERRSSAQSFACRKGKGSFNAVLEWQRIIRSAIGRWGFDFHIISIDFAKDYQSISLDVLKRLYRRAVPSERLCRILDGKIDSYITLSNEPELFKHEGLALGNIENQHLANLKSGVVDFFVTDTMGLGRMYVRYMDDIRIAVHTKEDAKRILTAIDGIITEKLSQKVSERKTHYRKFKGKDELCGYVVCPHHLEPKSDKLKRRIRGLVKVRREWHEGRLSDLKYTATLCNVLDYLDKTDSDHPYVRECIIELKKMGIRNKGVERYIKRVSP